MSLCILIPTRGRQALLFESVQRLIANCELDTTRIVLGFDDDEYLEASTMAKLCNPRTFLSRAVREDTLGDKYNRCALMSPQSEVYLLWADDMTVATKGFDRQIVEAAQLFTDGMGLVFFGKLPGVMQPGIAVTRSMAAAMGKLCDPSYAFWWQDTRLVEIGRMTDRIVDIGSSIEVQCLAELKGQSRGVRDLAFWGQYFDATRPQRKAIAERIIEQGDDQPFRKRALRSRLDAWDAIFAKANSRCSDPAQAKEVEAHFAFDAPADERYLRVRARAESAMSGMHKVAA